MKKISVLLALIFVLFTAPAALAASVDTQIDIGKFDCWMYSDGQTWQNVPGYGLVKPFDKPSVTYTVTYSGSNIDKITGVKSVTFFSGDETTYNKTARANDTKYDKYLESEFYKYSIKELTVNNYKYLGNGKVEITITSTLDTNEIDSVYKDYPGRYLHEEFQGKLTQGRRFYTPTVIEWELKEGAPDYWITSPNGTSFFGEPGSTITIPAEVWNSGNKTDTTDFIAWWDGDSWENNIGYYDNLTLGYGEKADTPVTVTVPEAPRTLWFRVNCDNNTPVGESDLTNNTLAVTVGPDGVDLGLFLIPSPDRAEIPWIMDTYPAKVHAIVARYDQGTEPIDAVLTLYTPFGTRTTNVTGIKSGEELEYILDFPISTAGTYVYNGIVEPSGGHVDIDLSDNQASCTMVITRMPTPPVTPKIEVESKIKGQLGG